MKSSIWNQLDEVALYQSLERMAGETDEELFARMKKFAKWRCKTDYDTQVHSIPIQTGLLTYPIMNITCSHPFEVKIDWEYFSIQSFPENQNDKEYARIFINTESSVVDKITNILDNLASFSYEVINPSYRNIHHKFMVRHNSVSVETDYIDTKNANLSNKNILKNSFRPSSTLYCREMKNSIQDLKKPGDFFLDLDNGYLQTFSDVTDGFFVSYRTYQTRVTIEATELNLMPVSTLTKYGLTDGVINVIPYLLNDKVWGG